MGLPILPTISTVFIVLSAILVAIGWILIVKRKIEAHKKVMFAAGVAAVMLLAHSLSEILHSVVQKN